MAPFGANSAKNNCITHYRCNTSVTSFCNHKTFIRFSFTKHRPDLENVNSTSNYFNANPISGRRKTTEKKIQKLYLKNSSRSAFKMANVESGNDVRIGSNHCAVSKYADLCQFLQCVVTVFLYTQQDH